MDRKKKRILLCILAAGLLVFAIALAVCAVRRIQAEKEQKQRVLVLAFDDYSAYTWESVFDLLDKYDAKVTFFINAFEPTDFCEKAIERGHEIGFHTASHVNLKDVSEEEFYNEAIAPIEIFRERGIELTSFAYPYGEYEDWMNEELLQYYKTLRGAYQFQVRFKFEIQGGFIESYSMDNIHYESDEDFQAMVVRLLDAFCDCDEGTVVSVYSHAIGDGEWCITQNRLEILLQEAEKRDIKCRTFQDLQ
ncbi:MAG: polysaccharide deacetylase family protein [Acetatifactor sp.]